VSFADALLLPLPTKAEAAVTPDRAAMYPREQKLLARYLGDVQLSKLPATLLRRQCSGPPSVHGDMRGSRGLPPRRKRRRDRPHRR
jgi:hypothetical protein